MILKRLRNLWKLSRIEAASFDQHPLISSNEGINPANLAQIIRKKKDVIDEIVNGN